MIISLISAFTTDHVISSNNNIPWNLSADLKWFKYNTINKPVIMGRKTFDSIGSKPLSDRLNIVLSRFVSNIPNVICAETPLQALKKVKNVNEVMIIGGGEIYNIFLSYAKRLYLTHINAKINGDTWFPNYKLYNWYRVFSKFHDVDSKHIYSFYFEILDLC